jgi:hypothetical protein
MRRRAVEIDLHVHVKVIGLLHVCDELLLGFLLLNRSIRHMCAAGLQALMRVSRESFFPDATALSYLPKRIFV